MSLFIGRDQNVAEERPSAIGRTHYGRPVISTAFAGRCHEALSEVTSDWPWRYAGRARLAEVSTRTEYSSFITTDLK
jgi:hypothetical protein